MWTLLLILIVVTGIVLLIKSWILFSNSLFRSSLKKTENYDYLINSSMHAPINQAEKPKPIENSETEPSGVVKASFLSDGIFRKADLPKRYQNSWSIYFQEYVKQDGVWVEINESVCKLRIGEYRERYEAVIVKNSKSGFLQHTTRNPLLFDHDIMFRINNKGNITDPNLISDERYEHYFNTLKCSFKRWLVEDGAFVKANSEVYMFYYDSPEQKRITKTHTAEIDGFIDIYDSPYNSSDSGTNLLYVIQKDDSIRVLRKFKNSHKITFDEFQKSKIIKWESVSTGDNWSFYNKPYLEGIFSRSDDQKVEFLFSFNYFKERDHIVFHFNPKQLNIQVNDVIEFLFENDRQIRFEINSKPISTKNNADEKVSEYFTVITKPELELFANVNLKKWKITFENGMKEVLGGDTGGIENYRSKHNLQIAIKKFAQDYISLVNKEIDDYNPIEVKEMTKESARVDDACYVYLMKDLSNGFYKIGISNNPEYRERTLQSEKPTIEMIASKKFPIRKIAESFERSLHITFADKRIRGEWFELSQVDEEHLKASLK
jgi:hypothetical protein